MDKSLDSLEVTNWVQILVLIFNGDITFLCLCFLIYKMGAIISDLPYSVLWEPNNAYHISKAVNKYWLLLFICNLSQIPYPLTPLNTFWLAIHKLYFILSNFSGKVRDFYWIEKFPLSLPLTNIGGKKSVTEAESQEVTKQ